MPDVPMTPQRQSGLWLVRRLREAGFISYFAGGCVRDALLGLTPNDYDIATDARPEDVKRLFRHARAVGESFGVMLARREGVTIEIATFRREWGYSDKRRPDGVQFSDAADDAARRDFTINALFEDPLAGEVLDYVGGLADLEGKLIRAVGEPFDRLEEDHLRALRAVRFAARFGFAIESRTEEAIRHCARRLEGVSRERIGEELRMLSAGASRTQALALLQQLGLDGPVLREENRVADLDTVARLPGVCSHPLVLAGWACDRYREWSARRMAADSRRIVSRWRRALMLSNLERDRLAAILRDLSLLENDWSSLTVAVRKRLASAPHFDDALTLLHARKPRPAEAVAANVAELSRHAGGLAPPPLLTGDDLIEMGFEPGPIFGLVLNAVYDAQLEGRVSTAEEARSLGLSLATAD